MRILIIEDEEKLAQSPKKGLERAGYAVDYLTDGEAGARRRLPAEKVDGTFSAGSLPAFFIKPSYRIGYSASNGPRARATMRF